MDDPLVTIPNVEWWKEDYSQMKQNMSRVLTMKSEKVHFWRYYWKKAKSCYLRKIKYYYYVQMESIFASALVENHLCNVVFAVEKVRLILRTGSC